ncbi:unnamed protein product [Haemonchus placei]|uniref:C-type lectin domain-containing protein n=1 Tax=Haemonchus placei TaxID=6290 RepID=A0A3P7VUH7_HAEPC|nr:unnamed protein product [Haemonchus placei]
MWLCAVLWMLSSKYLKNRNICNIQHLRDHMENDYFKAHLKMTRLNTLCVVQFKTFFCRKWKIRIFKCYRKFCDIATAEKAEKTCQNFNGRLVTICSEEENTFVADLAHHNKDRKGITNNWLRMSGSTCKYRNWASKEPNDLTHDEDYCHLWTSRLYFRKWKDNRKKRDHHYLLSLKQLVCVCLCCLLLELTAVDQTQSVCPSDNCDVCHIPRADSPRATAAA